MFWEASLLSFFVPFLQYSAGSFFVMGLFMVAIVVASVLFF